MLNKKLFFGVFLSTVIGCSKFSPPTAGVSDLNTPASIVAPTVKPKLALQGHRGARGLRPENTWPAFEEAIRLGMTHIELDVRQSRDNAFIIHHDAYLNPKNCIHADGSRVRRLAVNSLLLADLKQLDCGSVLDKKFPSRRLVPKTPLITLDEFFLLLKNFEKEYIDAQKVNITIDVKVTPEFTATDAHLEKIAQGIVQKVSTARMEKRVLVQSFELRLLPFVKKVNPTILTVALFNSFSKLPKRLRSEEKIIEKAKEYQADIVAPFFKNVTPLFVQKAHLKDMPLYTWTVNGVDEMSRLLGMGVDGIITDYPDRLNRVYESLYADIRKTPIVSP